jgi:hypothetical protein
MTHKIVATTPDIYANRVCWKCIFGKHAKCEKQGCICNRCAGVEEDEECQD